MGYTCRFALNELIFDLEHANRKRYTNTYIAEGAGTNRITIGDIRNNETRRIDMTTIERLLNFFSDEGMQVDIQDLIKVTNPDD